MESQQYILIWYILVDYNINYKFLFMIYLYRIYHLDVHYIFCIIPIIDHSNKIDKNIKKIKIIKIKDKLFKLLVSLDE